jgi:squalene-hopene/tetraprenyl-beta-curcumene cyclase
MLKVRAKAFQSSPRTSTRRGLSERSAPLERAAVVASLALALGACAPKVSPPAAAQSWDPAGAAAYLDRRINWWMSWKTSTRDHGTFCVSCHTVLPYALARGNLNRLLGSDSRVAAEGRVLDDVRTRVHLWSDTSPYYTDREDGPGKSAQARGTEAVLNALILASNDARAGHLSSETHAAFDDMWALQHRGGDEAGAWSWLDFDLAPWEVADAQYYGATLAALAVGIAPESYQSSAQIQESLGALRDYLVRKYALQSLHHRLVLMWAAANLPGILSPERRQSLIDATLRAQNADGGWSLSTLTSTPVGRQAPVRDSASDGYATGLATLALEQAATPTTAAGVARGLSWLVQHQGGHLGPWMRGRESFWVARSLNQRRNPWSNVGRFMTDAATAYAVLALTESPHSRPSPR